MIDLLIGNCFVLSWWLKFFMIRLLIIVFVMVCGYCVGDLIRYCNNVGLISCSVNDVYRDWEFFTPFNQFGEPRTALHAAADTEH